MTIDTSNLPRKQVAGLPGALREKLDNLPEPRKLPPSEGNVYMAGIGGTGVVTINQILATAAMLDGKEVNALDQTGLSQKGGPVVSHIRITNTKQPMSCMIGKHEADAYILFDLLSGTTEANLAKAKKDHTVAIVSDSKIPTGAMVRDKSVAFPHNDMLRKRLDTVTQAEHNIYFNAIALSEKLFGNHMQANIMTIGAAYQQGILPITALAIEHAIQLNGVAVEQNRQAFRIGRLVAINGGFLDENLLMESKKPAEPELSETAKRIISSVGASGELERLLQIRVPELIAHTNADYAQQYANFVAKVLTAEAGQGNGALSQAVARYLYKLMAYKDEYEVARLHLKSSFSDAVAAEFTHQAKVKFMLHPPLLRALGLKRKLALGGWIRPFLSLLANLKFLRGTPFDIFGYALIRREERRLIEEYKELIDTEFENLSELRYETAVEIAQAPDIVRGYEDIKLANIERYRAHINEILAKRQSVSGD